MLEESQQSCVSCQQNPSIVENVCCCYFDPIIPNLDLEDCESV